MHIVHPMHPKLRQVPMRSIQARFKSKGYRPGWLRQQLPPRQCW